MFRPALPAVVALVALVGCTRFPELDAAITEEGKAAPQPTLVDNRPLLAAAEGGTLDETTQTGLQARATALQGRSAALAAPVIDPADLAGIAESHDRLRQSTTRVAPDS